MSLLLTTSTLGRSGRRAGGYVVARTDRISGSKALLELVGEVPGLAVPYVVAVLAAVVTAVLMIISAPARRLIVVVAVTAAVAALVTLLATPLPTGNAIGATPDGRTIEFDVLSYRSWGCYLALAGALLPLRLPCSPAGRDLLADLSSRQCADTVRRITQWFLPFGRS